MTEKTLITYHATPDTLFETLKETVSGGLFFSVADENTAPVYTHFFGTLPDFITPAGEGAKSLPVLSGLWSRLLEKGLSRKDFLIAFGGGAVTDLTGFAAATYKRGMRLIHVPTTLIGMVDAASGGKTAIDFAGVKNSIGAFYLPDEVLVCTKFLETLPETEILSGEGELLKYALLMGRDPETFLSTERRPETVRECLDFKEEVVGADPKDTGLRQILNLGHTSGHALEALHLDGGGYEPVPHGTAVAAGLVIEAYCAFALRMLPQEELMTLARFTRDHFPPVLIKCKDYDRVWAFALQDKKNRADHNRAVTMSLIEAPGRPVTGVEIGRKVFYEGLDFYKDFFRI